MPLKSWSALRFALGASFLGLCVAVLLGPLLVTCLAAGASGLQAGLLSLNEADRERLAGLMAASLRITAGTVVLALLAGVTVAAAIHRSSGLWRTLWLVAFPIPLLIPPSVIAIAWTHILGRRGVVAAAWHWLSGAGQLPFSLYGEAGAAFVLALSWFPLVTLCTLTGLRAVGRESASARLFAGSWQRWRLIQLPLLLPYVSVGALLVAWLALADFDVPMVFLRNSFPLEIFAALQQAPNIHRALALCLPLLALNCLLLGASWILSRRHAPSVTAQWRTAQAQPRPAPLALQTAAVAVLALGCLVPLASLLHQAQSWAVVGDALRTAAPQLLNSFATALVGAVLMVAFSVPYAWIMLELRGWRRSALAMLALVPLAIPGTVQGLCWTTALVQTEWGRFLLSSPYVVSAANAAHFFPFGLFIVLATLQSLDRRLLQAAELAGAPWAQRLGRIALPLLYPGLLAALCIAFAVLIGELGCAILLAPPGHGTLPVRISALLHFNKDELVAALCLIQMTLALLPYLAMSLLSERWLEVNCE